MALLKGLFGGLKKGLTRTRETFTTSLRSLLHGRTVDDALIKELEAKLIQADLGLEAVNTLMERVRKESRAGTLTEGDQVIAFLKDELAALWPAEDRALRMAPAGTTTVILVTGINGAGKTTSIAKLASAIVRDGKSVMLGACDTYRAGAVRQLEIWSERLGIPIVKGQQGGDPAAVAFDACESALARKVDVLILDTAGRLQTQDPLMRQLAKIRNVIGKKIENAPHEVLLVLDATIGQNALSQAKHFQEAAGVTGVFLAKLDGTAKGGIAVAVRQTTGIPVKFVGTGETPDDIELFEPKRYLDALFADEAE
ncbi:MAG: signal recognition particle-docking protein FtsY [Phycisphaerales bacterium]|nr:signal recognition particle-docking protein FtsY [Phycisphaerales bacterium]